MRMNLWFLAPIVASCLLAVGAPKPNVLIVLTDDQGMGDFSCFGNPVLKTPNLDKLHAESIRFTDFHSAPMCTPTRGQLLTGVDAVRNGATSVTGGRSFLRPGIPTMPELFARAGYGTGIFGKWHLGDHYPHRPMDKGFQEAVYHLGPGYCTDFWFDRAMAWMKERQVAGQRFICYLPLNAPHAPHVVPAKYSAAYPGKGPAEFFGMIANIDENVGRLETFLRESGLREDTILLFMTDNGGTAGVRTWNASLRAGKTTFYEGGHRVPCWLRWPSGNLGKPREIAEPAQMQDVLPTLLELCSVEAEPKTAMRAAFDGISLAPLLRGSAEKLPDRMMVVQYSRAKLTKWECAVIWNHWRLVEGKELYDVQKDRSQTNDVAAARPDIVGKMREHYERWWAGLGAKPDQFVPCATLGAERQSVVSLTSSDWQDVYCDNAGHVRRAVGGPRGGPWLVDIAHSGNYEIALRRWPHETRLALGDASGAESTALPIAAGRIVIAGQELSAEAQPTDQEVVIQAKLPAGRTTFQAWFQDAQSNDLAGAYFAYVRRTN